MTGSSEKRCSYKLNIEKATNAVQEKDYKSALGYIKCALVENQDYPQVHNLLGIIAEFKNDLSLAGKHYRASYALDPTYRPANRNLDRITSFFYDADNTSPDYGDIPEEEIIAYIGEYDEKNVGHLREK